MSRVIKTDSAGKDRALLVHGIFVAIQELARQNEINNRTRDLAAFIALSLEAVSETIDASVIAWEKRGYWVKADRFRLEWEWSGRLGGQMRQAVIDEDWTTVAKTAAQAAEKLKDIKPLKRQPKTEPWNGAWHSMINANVPK